MLKESLTECQSDLDHDWSRMLDISHRLIVGKLNLRLKPARRQRGKKTHKRTKLAAISKTCPVSHLPHGI